jgi:hypothetical protein
MKEAITVVGHHHLQIDIEVLSQEMIISTADLLDSLMFQVLVVIRARRQDSLYTQLLKDFQASRQSMSLLRDNNLVNKLIPVI